MALYSDMNGFPESGFPVLADMEDRITLNTLYYNPIRHLGYKLDVVGNNRLLGALILGGGLSGVTTIAMGGALSGATTIGASGNVTLSGGNLIMTNGNILMASGEVGSILQRIKKAWLTNLHIQNRPTCGNEDEVALVSDLQRLTPHLPVTVDPASSAFASIDPDTQVLTVNAQGGTQVQSDWNQAVNTEPDYIKNKPTIPAAQVQTDWNAASGMGVLLNKPTIPVISDTAYNATSWDGVTGEAPSKNAIRDKIESIMSLFSGYALGGWFEFSRSTIYTGMNEFQIGWASSVHQDYTFEFTLRSNTGALISVGMYHGAYSTNDTPKGVLTPLITFSSIYITNIELVDSGSFLVLKFTYAALPIGYKIKGSYTKTA